jgi:formylglycine-generating enzyme required for sulfatase activity
VEHVSWFDASEFCRRISIRENRRYRLPYEAEWEYVCRAGTKTRFWFGDALECDDSCCCLCPPAVENMQSCAEDYHGIPNPVARKKPNAWGFYDMHAHVPEWCQDWYEPYPEGTQENPAVDPRGTPEGKAKVARGIPQYPGSGLRVSRSAFRGKEDPIVSNEIIGFRVVLELPVCSYGD